MSNLSQSPSPNKITTLYVPRPNWATREVVWGFWLTVDGRSHYADWAMPAEQVAELTRHQWENERKHSAFQYWMPYGDGMGLRAAEEPVSEVEAEPVVDIDGQGWTVRDTLTVETLRRVSRRAAEQWQRRGIVAKVELRRGQRGWRPWVAYQRADGSFSRPWRGSLLAN